MHDPETSAAKRVMVDVLMGDRMYVSRYLEGCAARPRWQRWLASPWQRHRRDPSRFQVGWGPTADAPADDRLVPRPAHTLVAIEDGRCVLFPTAAMAATIATAGEMQRISGEDRLALPVGARARIECGAITVRVGYETAPVAIAQPGWRERATRNAHVLFALLGTAALALLLALLPPDTFALMFEHGGPVPQLTTFTIPIEPPAPLPATASSGPAPEAPEKTREMKAAPPRKGGGRTRPDNVVSKGVEAAGDPSQAGMLGILTQQGRSDALQAVFAEADADHMGHVLGELKGTSVASAWHTGGMNVDNRSGDGEDLRGAGRLHTVGDCVGTHCGEGGNRRYGDRVGKLGPRPPKIIDVMGCKDCAKLRGGLDKEIVRRTIRSHVNEVRHCYETRLEANPNLQGRLSVQFVISKQGTVVTAAVQESTMPDPRVTSCVVEAVRRWQFPVAEGAGLTIVSYPFVFMTAAAQP